MSLSRRTKVILTAVGALVALLVALLSFDVYRVWHKFSVEDRIHGVFFPVVRALDEYQHDQGIPAANLAQLVPKYLSELPRSTLVDAVQYSVLGDGRTWQLSLHSRVLDPPRVYCCRSGSTYTAEEEKRVLLRYHGYWVVLRD